jgi:hypothetical protein
LDLFYTNRRAQVQAIKLRYLDFLHETKDKTYPFLESLILSGQRYPENPYRYALTASGNWVKEFVKNSDIDNYFLPSIFCFPYIDWHQHHGNQPVIPNNQGVVWGLRLLQIVAAADRLFHSDPNFNRLTVKELCDILYDLFSYPRNESSFQIDSFTEYGYIALDGQDFPVYRQPYRLNIKMLPKSQYLLSNIMYDITYLNLSSMIIPLASSAIDTEPPFLVAASLETEKNPKSFWRYDVSQSLVQWVAAKITNSIALSQLCSSIAKEQKITYHSSSVLLRNRSARWNRLLNELEVGRNGIEGIFEYEQTVRGKIKIQTDQLIESIYFQDPNALIEIENLVTSFFDSWK